MFCHMGFMNEKIYEKLCRGELPRHAVTITEHKSVLAPEVYRRCTVDHVFPRGSMLRLEQARRVPQQRYNGVHWQVNASLEGAGSSDPSSRTRADTLGNEMVFPHCELWLRVVSDAGVWLQRARTASKETFADSFSTYSSEI